MESDETTVTDEQIAEAIEIASNTVDEIVDEDVHPGGVAYGVWIQLAGYLHATGWTPKELKRNLNGILKEEKSMKTKSTKMFMADRISTRPCEHCGSVVIGLLDAEDRVRAEAHIQRDDVDDVIGWLRDDATTGAALKAVIDDAAAKKTPPTFRVIE